MTVEPEAFPHGIGAEPPRPIHSFTMVTGLDGSRQLLIFKRIDFREIVQVGFLYIGDGAIDAKEIGEALGAAFDMELVTRANIAQEGKDG
ncbi:MAG TPA: hypothetical protein VG271_13430 [Beijerinckiaceae bacterium]|jgi:hypothetical protein|nr:hypothetical protein [Beijerinckiaceae bacterium]